MAAARSYDFETHTPVELRVEVGKGSVHVTATETTVSRVEVTGQAADDVEVRQDGHRISVVAPRQRGGFFGSDLGLDVAITVPLTSELAVRTNSAAVTAEGTIGSSVIRSGSGDVRLADLTGPGLVETGSGDISIDLTGDELRVKSGSGEVGIEHSEGPLVISTGSGDVRIGTANAQAAVKTGSGDVEVGRASTDMSMSTGSGDLAVGAAHRGRLTVKGVSGDIRVGVPAGVPVWTDIATISGSIHSALRGAGEPADGADHLELRAETVSGDIVLDQV